MVQVFMALRCYSCKTFQVHQVKKTNKWVCKICNEKQSVLKTYGKGTGKECRIHVQKLNMLRGKEREVEDAKYCRQPSPQGSQGYANTFASQGDRERNTLDSLEYTVVYDNSKWTSFLSPKNEDDDKDEDKCYTTEKDQLSSACTSKKQVKSSSDKRSSCRVMFPDKEDVRVCPYSSSSLCSSTSMRLFHPNLYSKLQKDCPNFPSSNSSFSGDRPRSPQANLLSASPSPSTAGDSHKERIRPIKQDLQKNPRRDCVDMTCKLPGSGTDELSRGGGSGSGSIPRASSRWSHFMCKENICSEEEERRNGEEDSQHAITTLPVSQVHTCWTQMT